MSNNNDNADDKLFELTEEEKQSGLDAIDPLPNTNHVYIVRFKKGHIKVDLSVQDWAPKLRTESKYIDVPDEALKVAVRRMHLIETEKLSEKANRTKDDEIGSNLGAETSLGPEKETDAEKLIELLEAMNHEYFLDQHGQAFAIDVI